DAGEECRFLHPAVGKHLGAIEIDRSSCDALRHHPDRAPMLENEGIGEMRADIEHRTRNANGPCAAEFDCRNHPIAKCMSEVLDEYEQAAVAFDRKGVRVEAPPVIGKIAP